LATSRRLWLQKIAIFIDIRISLVARAAVAMEVFENTVGPTNDCSRLHCKK
jgi:hypothetical protein